jgi:hypothetical protein
MPRKVVGIAAVAVATLVATLLPVSPAGAVLRSGAPGTVRDPATQLILSNTGPGSSVNGFLADPTNPFDPVSEGYPSTDPAPGTGWTGQSESFAGVIIGSPTDGSPNLDLYCINIRTDTFIGVGYQLGTWDSANVANIGYVARLLNTYYPETNEPSTISDVNQKAAAVQAAVWFFSDRYVLSTSDPLHDAVAAIVHAVILAGALPEPSPPTLSITPSTLAGPIGSVIGPYTVHSTTVGEATVSAVGGTMYSDASATTVIPDGSTVPDGTKIWVRSTGPLAVAILATATATVPSGNAYLYDQNTPGLADAQKLILAKEATLKTTVSASAQFQLPGSLTVTKTITGPAAGHQGQVVIQVVCDGVALSPDFIIFSGTGAGDRSRVFSPIDAGSVCQVNETQDGHSSTVTVTTTGNGSQVTIPPDGNVGVHLTDTYDFVPGSLIVNKSIEGPAAGHQGAITIHVVCNGVAQSPDFVIPALATGEPSHQYDDIPAGSVCTITEPDNGSNTEVAPPTTVLPGPVTVPAARIAEATVTDTYDFNSGALVVNKSITGTPGGPVVITVTCVDPEGTSTTLSPPVSIPPGPNSQTYTGIAGNSRCTAVEDPDGSSSSISVEKGGDPQATVPPGGSASIDLTNTYVTGLVVNKIIEGPAAGRQGALTINTSCEFGGVTTALTPIDIPANAPAGITTRDYPGIVAGSVCTTTEISAGNPANVEVATTVTPTQPVTVPTSDATTVDVTNDYTFVPGSLVVTKEIAGPAGGQQGAVTIQVSCVDENGNQLEPGSLTLGPNAGTGAHDSTFAVPSGSVCTVTEVADGSTQTVTVTTSGSPTTVTIPGPPPVPPVAGTATVTDTYTLADGSLLLSKTISGPSAGQQGAVTIDVTCGTTTFAPFVIPARTKAGTFTHSVDRIPANSTCTVTETSDGSSSTVVVTVTGGEQKNISVLTGTVVPVEIDNVYSDGPGSLVVTKTLTGPAAGQQGPISILADCGGPETFALDIPAGTAAGSVPQVFDTIPAGSTCTVTETVNGGSDSIAVVAVGSDQTVTIPNGGTASVALVDSFAAVTSAAKASALAFTGAAARQLGELAAVLILFGGLAVAAARPETWRRWRARRKR